MRRKKTDRINDEKLNVIGLWVLDGKLWTHSDLGNSTIGRSMVYVDDLLGFY
jgi:hypothetical protein